MSYTLKRMNFRGWETLVNKDAGYAPYFSSIVRHNILQKRACNVVVTGEPGAGKSYLTTDICRAVCGLTRKGKDRLALSQVVFTYRDYMKLIIWLRMGAPIIFDEPSYAMGKRDWYKDLNKALVQTIESQRFKVHPLFIPIINKSLLDKTIRSFLIQWQIHVTDRGKATVYRIYPSQHTDKVYRYTFCDLEYDMFDSDLCSRDSCLDCPTLAPKDQAQACQLFRAQYERKKASIQDERYQEAYEQAARAETTHMTDAQAEDKLYSIRDKFVNTEGRIDVDMMLIVALRELDLKMGHNKAYRIAKALRYDHPDEFQ